MPLVLLPSRKLGIWHITLTECKARATTASNNITPTHRQHGTLISLLSAYAKKVIPLPKPPSFTVKFPITFAEISGTRV